MTSDHEPPNTPVTDARVIPTRIIPRSAKTWILGGGALLLVAVGILFGGRSDIQKAATEAITPPTTPVASERLRNYEGQLRQVPVAAPVVPPIDPPGAYALGVPLTTRPAPYVDTPSGYGVAQPPPVDPIIAERKRRDYESLFAPTVVFSRRPANETLTSNVAGPQPASTPSLDDITRSVLRLGSPPPAVGVAAQPPVTPPPPPAATADTPRTLAAGRHRVYEGTVIDAVLANRLDGSGIAPVRALITNDVYSQDLTRVIPAGAAVLGTASAVQGFGQSRLAVAFHRIVGAGGLDISLDQFVGLNIAGDAGLKDKVNAHYLSTFGAAAAVGLIGGLSQAIGGGVGGGNTTIVIGGAGDAASQAAAQTMSRFLNRQPTITIREGTRLKVYLTSDLDLQAYNY